MRTRAMRRFNSRRKALRKQKLAKRIYAVWFRGTDAEYYNNLHQYSKNKIYSSSAYTRRKTNNKGRRRKRQGNYDLSKNYSKSDLRKIQAMAFDESDYFEI